MPGALFDTNVWLAAVFASHPFHKLAQQVLQRATPANPAIFCRYTEQSFLRLASTPALLKVYGAQGMTNRDAWLALDTLQALPQVGSRDETPGLRAVWRTLASADAASPKLWMDAYLAAFAISGGLRMVTLDRDFTKFVVNGLDLALVNA